MDTVKITFENKVQLYPRYTTYKEISCDSSVSNILGIRINNEIYPLTKKANEEAEVEFINVTDLIGNKMYKSALKFIFQVALSELFPEAKITYEHSVPRGMLGVVHNSKILTHEDIAKIRDKMAQIVQDDLMFEKLLVHPKEAIKYYQQVNELEKADNVQNINDRVVMFYKLKNQLNYFYSEMPYSTGVITEYELVYLGNNKIIFLFPSIQGNGKVEEYVHYDNILETFSEGKKWLEKQKMSYISELNRAVSFGSVRSFINSCELDFSLKMADVANKIRSNPSIKVILIAGPSSSGKTTTTKRISSYMEMFGYDTIKISIDDYFVDREKTPRDSEGKYNFECLEAIDLELFNKQIVQLLNNEEVNLPLYNFITGKREISKTRVKLKENSIILIEGLHSLNDELTKVIAPENKFKIYLSPFIPMNVDRHNYISTLDMRLLRRIIRDNRTRGYDVAKTIDHWQSVRKGEELYIFPYIHQADVIINTALSYEVGVLKVFVEPLLYSVGVDSVYYEEARRLISFLKQFYPIPGEYVQDESILREFIGGKFND